MPPRVHRLATGWADVVVENFRPGVLERHGLGWDELHGANPAVILVVLVTSDAAPT